MPRHPSPEGSPTALPTANACPRCEASQAARWVRARGGSGRAAGAGGAALEGATLVFGESTPHARVLSGLEGVLQADLGDGATGADRFGLLDLVDRGAGVADREEQFGVDCQAGGFVAPIHGGAP